MAIAARYYIRTKAELRVHFYYAKLHVPRKNEIKLNKHMQANLSKKFAALIFI